MDAYVHGISTRSVDDLLDLDATYCQHAGRGACGLPCLGGGDGDVIDGTRGVLGTAVGDSESFEFWREFLVGLRGRGLSGGHLVVSEAHAGLKLL
jgi:transposase-like protein